jgi:hypothetical protein
VRSTAPAPSPEAVQKARAAEAERVQKARELHGIRVAKASADLAITLTKADTLRASLRAMEKLADDGFSVTINESPSEIQYVTPEQAQG